MGHFDDIRREINDNIFENQDGDISGASLNEVLNDMIDAVEVAVVPPFKGWWPDLVTLKASIAARPGDYAYVVDPSPATTASIYEYSSSAESNNYWADSGMKADTSKVQTFKTGEEVNEVPIDSSHLENVQEGSLPLAKDVVGLKDRIVEDEERIYLWSSTPIDTSSFLDNGIRGSMKRDNTWEVTASQYTYVKHYAFQVTPGDMIVVKSPSNNPSYIAFFTSDYDNSSVPTNGASLPLVAGYSRTTINTNRTMEFVVPDNAAWMCVNTGTTGQYVPASITVMSKTDSKLLFEDQVVDDADSYDGSVPLAANQGRILGEKLKDISITEAKITTYEIGDGYVNGTNGNTPGSETYKHAVIALQDGMFKLRFYGQTIGSQAVTGSAFYDEDGNFMVGYKFPERTGSENTPTEIILNIPYRAKTFKTTIQTSLINADDFYCYATSGLTISDKVYEGSSRYLTLSNTYIYNDGHTSYSTYYRTTSPIFGGHGFYLELNEGYRIYKVSLFDVKGNIVDPTYIPPTLGIPTYAPSNQTWKGRTWFSSLCILPQFYVKITIKRYDEARIGEDETDSIIKEFCYIDDQRLKKEFSDQPWFHAVKNRLAQLANIMLDPKKKILASEVSTTVTEPGETNNYFFYPGKRRTGVPYSEAIQYAKLVGLQVTPYTYLTALNNMYSLMYTESLYSNESGYGIQYVPASIHYYTSYFGIVCTALTGFALGLPTFYHTEFYTVSGGDTGIDGMEAVTVPSGSTAFDEAGIFDIIWYDGHCSMVSDIIYDEYGRRKYVVWAESLRPTPFITAYTKDQFNARISRSSCRLYRYDKTKIGLDNIDDSKYVQLDWFDYPKKIQYNNDICTFAGDKATFAEGDEIWLNFERSEAYTKVELFKDDDENPLYSINLSEVAGNAVDLTSYSLEHGKYKARLAGQDQESDYTYFEVVAVSLSYTISGDDTTISFSTVGCTPISVNCCSAIGYSKYIHVLTDAEKLAGSTTRSWDYTYNSNPKFIRIIVRGDYGNVAVKNVEVVR